MARSMEEQWQRFGEQLGSGRGRLPAEVRREIRRRATDSAGGDGIPPELAAFADLVAERSYRVTEATVTGLTAAGHSDDEIFETAAVAAYGAADRRLRAARRAWGGR
ncbi:hypothetical protein F3087_05835 [Nocardia colli]|uniref:Uncharacterized protein n=1 Tax=Nocardia colli TaxID=2545717 RepID=A0A5N0EQL5_9NOCA|nr:hypothetical protein [Nocardia colli]KAA8890754.1 hypothetical protein F3087_05835 [Nocardia colli]